jgi:hypothetical protein|tara:strand:+ start:263 stop:484 length:222 start_codon:yes stop_codon:yes gene_type:complete
MALEDLKSAYGPTNKKGKPGTGQVFDSLAYEGVSGFEGVFHTSKYSTKGKPGKPVKGPDTGGNIPPESLATLG